MFCDISFLTLVTAPFVGLCGMFAGGYWGVGCGWLIVPVMLLLGLTPMESVGIALLQMVPSTLPTVLKTVNEIPWKRRSLGRSVVIPMAAGALIGSFAGLPVNQFLYRHFGSAALMILFACIMVIICLQTALSRTRESSEGMPEFTRKSVAAGWISGGVTGVFSSVLGVGGAVLMRPILSSGFKVPERETSVAIRILLLVTTLAGGITYLFEHGDFQWRIIVLTFLISAGGIIGFPLGVRLHNLVARNGYTQFIHKSFAVIPAIVVVSTVLKLCGLSLFSRYLMIGFAVILIFALLAFGVFTSKNPR